MSRGKLALCLGVGCMITAVVIHFSDRGALTRSAPYVIPLLIVALIVMNMGVNRIHTLNFCQCINESGRKCGGRIVKIENPHNEEVYRACESCGDVK